MTSRTSSHSTRTSTAILGCVLCAFTGACGAPAPLSLSSWTGDAKFADGVDRIEVTVDSTGMAARVTLAAWHLDSVTVARTVATGDSLVFTALVDQDTLRLMGAHADGMWHGAIALGERHASVQMVRLFALGAAEERTMVGSYRTDSGHVIGIAPFSEFGTRLMVIDYESGRVGPAFPVSRDEFVVGHSVVSPAFPVDSMTLTRSATGTVEQIRFAENGRPSTIATRVTTRDEEVQFSSGSIRLAGTLVLPPGPPPYPALVLVHGSNAQTRDAHGPWSRFFAAHGFAVLSYDKRGTGTSTGDWKLADFDVLADDALAGVRFLASRPDIKRDRVGLWGISQGGWVLPIVAAKAASEVAFLVVHAGSGTSVREEGVLYLQAELRAAGLPPSSVEIGTRYQQLDDLATATGSGWQELQRFYETHRIAEPWLWPPRPADDWFRAYYRMLMGFDPTSYWRRVRCPVLLFFGEFDANVPPTESWPPIERALHDGGNTQATKVLLAKANHLFLEAKTGGRDEYPGLTRFTPGYFNRMAEWLKTVAH